MKNLFLLSIALLLLQVSALAQRNLIEQNHEPIFFKVSNHDPNFKSFPEKSFYQQKADWRHIIDSTWGTGLPLSGKLAVFDGYSNSLYNSFDGFLSLGLNGNSWESLKNNFRSRIDSTTSRGIFASIMSQFAMSLRDAHTWAWDTVVTFTPLNPGVPILVLYPFATAEHFGAVLTSLPDSTALVLRTVQNHPLGLQPGDIVLGYEGVPWKNLVMELLEAHLPVFSTGVGAASAQMNSFIRNVGNNWHLFDTIDILKHSTGDTVHLSVQPLLNLPTDPMMGNEQLEIPGIPFSFYRGWPWQPTGQLLAYGMLPTANVGYIRLLGEWPSDAADPLFAAAIDSLWDTEGLIIDLRWNSGGWALFNEAFGRMFSQNILTIEDAYRASPTDFTLVPAGNSNWFLIPGAAGSLFDRPIAVLLGPTCVSMGDITAQRLRYHPMARFFGKSSIASLGDNKDVSGYPNWWLHHSLSDMFHTSQPGVYLNRKEFPVDESVWFNPDDVASGIDPVLTKALDWINNYTAVQDHNDENVVNKYALVQNYPNPFNPSTTLQYSIPNRSLVVLKVYDILGNEVATLVNEEKEQGVHTISFDAGSLASGLYLYRIQAGSFIETKKMILLK